MSPSFLAVILIFVVNSYAAGPVDLNPKSLKKTGVAVETAKVYEPQEGKLKNYSGYPVTALLKKLYGSKFDKADTLSFYCSDGYRADIPLAEFQKKKSWLAFGMADGSPFTLKSDHGPIDLAPYYLIWDHPNAAAAQKDEYRWPYAVTQVEAIQSSEAYKPLTAPAEFETGHKLFMQYCFSCHELNNAGGHRGPPLNAFFKTQTDDFLKTAFLDPKKIVPTAQMPAFGTQMPAAEREKAAHDIIAYVKKVAH